jgi:hypothetical protein
LLSSIERTTTSLCPLFLADPTHHPLIVTGPDVDSIHNRAERTLREQFMLLKIFCTPNLDEGVYINEPTTTMLAMWERHGHNRRNSCNRYWADEISVHLERHSTAGTQITLSKIQLTDGRPDKIQDSAQS